MELILIVLVLVLLFGGGGGYWGRSRGYWWPGAFLRSGADRFRGFCRRPRRSRPIVAFLPIGA